MVKALLRSRSLTEFLTQSEVKSACEYVDGQVIQKPMPQAQHSLLQGELVTTINQQCRPQRIARAFPELRCTFGGRSIVPDIVVLPWAKFPRNADGSIANAFELAPDWTIKILSPDQSQTRVVKNILHCLNYGGELGWLVIPGDRAIWVYRPNQQVFVFDQPEDIPPLPEFVGNWTLKVKTLFDCLWE